MNRTKLLEKYTQDEILYIGPTGSSLIGIEDPKDYDFLVIVNETKNNERILFDRTEEKHSEFYIEQLNEIKETILGHNNRSNIGGIACLCAIPDTIYEMLEMTLETLIPNVKTRTKKLITQSPYLSKYVYYLPLIKHILETNNHNYTEEELELARRFYYKQATDEEYQELYNYFGLEFVN